VRVADARGVLDPLIAMRAGSVPAAAGTAASSTIPVARVAVCQKARSYDVDRQHDAVFLAEVG
jgi:hypothetical protein